MAGYSERNDGLDREGDKKKQKKRTTQATEVDETAGLDRLFEVCWGRHEIGFDELGEKLLGPTQRWADMAVIERMLELENEAWEKGYGGLEYSIDESRRTVCVEGITGGLRDVAEVQAILGGLLERVEAAGGQMHGAGGGFRL